MHIIVGLLFVLHTVGLIARWYISGHAPWSNAYDRLYILHELDVFWIGL
jgi:ABC-type transport system involved in cytochrome c biogenesis permease subunit